MPDKLQFLQGSMRSMFDPQIQKAKIQTSEQMFQLTDTLLELYLSIKNSKRRFLEQKGQSKL